MYLEERKDSSTTDSDVHLLSRWKLKVQSTSTNTSNTSTSNAANTSNPSPSAYHTIQIPNIANTYQRTTTSSYSNNNRRDDGENEQFAPTTNNIKVRTRNLSTYIIHIKSRSDVVNE